MIVRPHLIFAKRQAIFLLKHLTFPDFDDSKEFAKYVMREWQMPPDMLKGFIVPPDCEVTYNVSPIIRNPEGDFAYMFLTFSNAHLVSLQMYQALNDPQKEVVNLMRLGMNDKQMAQRLNKSRRWVQYRIAELKRYYNVTTRMQLGAKIYEHAILKRS